MRKSSSESLTLCEIRCSKIIRQASEAFHGPLKELISARNRNNNTLVFFYTNEVISPSFSMTFYPHRSSLDKFLFNLGKYSWAFLFLDLCVSQFLSKWQNTRANHLLARKEHGSPRSRGFNRWSLHSMILGLWWNEPLGCGKGDGPVNKRLGGLPIGPEFDVIIHVENLGVLVCSCHSALNR